MGISVFWRQVWKGIPYNYSEDGYGRLYMFSGDRYERAYLYSEDRYGVVYINSRERYGRVCPLSGAGINGHTCTLSTDTLSESNIEFF